MPLLFSIPESLLHEQEQKPGSRLVGIARLAAQGEAIDAGHQVDYITLPVRSLLNKCTSPRMPFTWTINPYRGCEFACKYCYARYTHEFMELRDPLDFERKIYIKQQAAHRLRRDLRRVKPGEDIAIGTATDPYQPAERRHRITRSVLEELALHAGLSIGIVTKSFMVLRDIDLLQRIAEHNDIAVNITVTTMDTHLARILEPRAPRPDLRMTAVKKLSRNGIETGVICSPVLPGITDSAQSLEAVVRAAAQAGARHIFANPLFLKPCSEKVFLPFLEQHFPQKVAAYRAHYRERAFLPIAYRKRISALMAKLRRDYGMAGRWEDRRVAQPPAAEAEQLALF